MTYAHIPVKRLKTHLNPSKNKNKSKSELKNSMQKKSESSKSTRNRLMLLGKERLRLRSGLRRGEFDSVYALRFAHTHSKDFVPYTESSSLCS